jgi:hypothetical protein
MGFFPSIQSCSQSLIPFGLAAPLQEQAPTSRWVFLMLGVSGDQASQALRAEASAYLQWSVLNRSGFRSFRLLSSNNS